MHQKRAWICILPVLVCLVLTSSGWAGTANLNANVGMVANPVLDDEGVLLFYDLIEVVEEEKRRFA